MKTLELYSGDLFRVDEQRIWDTQGVHTSNSRAEPNVKVIHLLPISLKFHILLPHPSTMSRASKLTLGATSLFAVTTIFCVHFQQKAEQAVRRDHGATSYCPSFGTVLLTLAPYIL